MIAGIRKIQCLRAESGLTRASLMSTTKSETIVEIYRKLATMRSSPSIMAPSISRHSTLKVSVRLITDFRFRQTRPHRSQSSILAREMGRMFNSRKFWIQAITQMTIGLPRLKTITHWRTSTHRKTPIWWWILPRTLSLAEAHSPNRGEGQRQPTGNRRSYHLDL